jgi:hypothetical protein
VRDETVTPVRSSKPVHEGVDFSSNFIEPFQRRVDYKSDCGCLKAWFPGPWVVSAPWLLRWCFTF